MEPFPVSFGQYQVLRVLGEGAMGIVYLTEDVKLGRQVALKVPKTSVVEQPEQLARFLREARACAGLRHHNICPVYEVNELNGTHYIAMAFIEGKPLSELLQTDHQNMLQARQRSKCESRERLAYGKRIRVRSCCKPRRIRLVTASGVRFINVVILATGSPSRYRRAMAFR